MNPNKEILFKFDVNKFLIIFLYIKTISKQPEIKNNRNILNIECIFLSVVTESMKGRTTCPKCKHQFILDVPKDCERHEAVCPKCEKKFIIKAISSDKKSDEECLWEEYGEPRKTILSSIKRKTNRPKIASILLICVFILGLTNSVFSETFITTSMDLASGIGLKGSIKIQVTDLSNNSLENINIKINEINGTTNQKGIFYKEDIELGIQTLKILSNKYENQTNEILITPFLGTESTIKLENGSSNKISTYDSTGCSIIFAIFSIFALLGAITTLKRQHLDVSIVGSLIGIFTFGFFFIGSILSIIAFIIIMRVRDEFENGKKGKIF